MARRFLACLMVSVAAWAVFGAGAAGADEAFESLAPGLDYRHESRAEGPLSIHVIRIDLHQHWELHTFLGQGTVFGLEPLPGIVARGAAQLKRPAAAAINGDFFLIKPGPYQGDPSGLDITEGELVSRPTGHSIWVGADGQMKLGSVEAKFRVIWPDGATETPLGLNETRPDDQAVLDTPTLGLRPGEKSDKPVTTRTTGGTELVLEAVEGQPWLPIRAGVRYKARVREVRDSGDTALRAGTLVLSIGPKLTVPKVKVGDVLQLVMETSPSLEGVTTALGVHHIYLKTDEHPDLGGASQAHNPRSMIGWNKTHVFFFVVDGRQKELSMGMTYPQMAALAKEYGCTEAAEFDGGGSSTIWAKGKILNSPSDGHPRPVANGLIVFPTAAADAKR